jgi:arylsulfatase A-like enzyme
MSRRKIIGSKFALLLTTALMGGFMWTPDAAHAQQSQIERSGDQKQPNIVFILIDDLGYTDIGAFGGNIQTPNIDALASVGVRFSNAHVYPSCAPTRAGFITGRNPHQVGLGSQNGVAPPGVPTTTFGYKGTLEGNFVGIATTLAKAGYQTYHSGKWHLGHEDQQTPESLGFQASFALMDGAASHYHDMLGVSPSVSPGGHVIYTDHGKVVTELPTNFFSTEAYTQKMIEMIDDGLRKDRDKPFFSYLAYTAVHDPLHAPEDLILKYRDLFSKGYINLKDERIAGMVKQGLIADASLATRWLSGTPKWDTLTDDQKKDMSARMAVHAAMLEHLDIEVGRLIGFLKEKGEYENTVFVVMSDNGAATIPKTFYAQNNDELFWQKKHYPLEAVKDYGKQGSFATIGSYNAQAVAGPYFGFKTNLHEGGTRVPMIVKTPQSSARIENDFVHIVDLYPTFAELAGVDLTERKDLMGCSIRSLLDGPDGARCSDEFGVEYMGWRAYRQGNWKLVFVSPAFGGTGKYALYDLAQDPGETNDLSQRHPDKVAELSKKWDSFAKAQNVTVADMTRVNAAYEKISDAFLKIYWGQ